MRYSLPALLFVCTLGFFIVAEAQQSEPQLMVTWSTPTYVPFWFHGKALPTANSSITASVELVDGGSIVDLSGQKIYWYVNDQFVNGGVGLQKVAFSAPSVANNIMDLRVEVPSYKSSQANAVLKTVEIPVVRGEAVIEAPFPDSQFSSDSLDLNGWPFFFNTKDSSRLKFSWSANGESSQNLENPEALTVNINPDAASGSSLNVLLSISVPGSISDIATAVKNLTFIR